MIHSLLVCFAILKAGVPVFAGPTVMVDAVEVSGQRDSRLRTVAVTVYLRNDGDLPFAVPVGPDVGVLLSSSAVVFTARVTTLHSGQIVKPSPAGIDIVELKPGDVVRLRSVSIERPFEDRGPIKVVYSVDSSLLAFYTTWVGKVEGHYPGDQWEKQKSEEKTEPNQALQTTSVTRSGFGRVSVTDRQRRGV